MLTNLDPDRMASDYGPRARLAEREIDLHLQHTPWIDLGLTFDHEAAYAEAAAVSDRFVAYKSDPSYDVQGWTGLALQALDGDASRVTTDGDPHTATRPDADYILTDVAERCPTVMQVVRELMDLENTQTVALLKLGPGGTIYPHIDGHGPIVMRSTNVALNMPDGCRFVIDCGPRGETTPRTRQVPFRPGTAMALNVARYHTVVNASDTPRIHIVARGCWRLSTLTILARARAQNALVGEDAVREALARR